MKKLQAETGLTFGQWRERLRMQAAMPLLADGLTVETVARRTGYASASSFVAAFHRVVGVTPSRSRSSWRASSRGVRVGSSPSVLRLLDRGDG